LTGAKYDRQLVGMDMKALDQRPRFPIAAGIDLLEGMAVAPKKTLQSEYISSVAEAHNDRTAGLQLNQTHSAQNKGPHDAFAKFGFGDQ